MLQEVGLLIFACAFWLWQTVSEDQDEVYDYSYECSTWNGTNDEPCSLAMEIDECEVVTSGEDIQELFTRDAKPDEEEYEGYTGNEGATIECRYHKSMLVGWPKKNEYQLVKKTTEQQEELPRLRNRLDATLGPESSSEKRRKMNKAE